MKKHSFRVVGGSIRECYEGEYNIYLDHEIVARLRKPYPSGLINREPLSERDVFSYLLEGALNRKKMFSAFNVARLEMCGYTVIDGMQCKIIRKTVGQANSLGILWEGKTKENPEMQSHIVEALKKTLVTLKIYETVAEFSKKPTTTSYANNLQ